MAERRAVCEASLCKRRWRGADVVIPLRLLHDGAYGNGSKTGDNDNDQ